MSLTIEELKFLRQINNKNVKLEKLANTNNMSTRNIRYKIDNLNFYLKRYINKNIKIVNGTVIVNILYDEEKMLFNMIEKSILKFSKEERQEIIINMYLFGANVTLSKIEKILNVTRTTLNKDIKDINQKIKHRDIRLDLEGKRIALIGNEKKLRHYKAEQLLKYSTIKGKSIVVIEDFLPSSEIIQKLIKNYLNLLPMRDMEVCIENIQKLLNVKFETGFYKMMFLYLAVTIERIKSNHIIKKKNNEKFLKNLEQYKILKEVLKDTINEDYKYEFLHLTEYLISGYSSTKFVNSEYAINIFTQNILIQLEEKLKIKLRDSSSLVEDIEEYLNPAMYRIKNNFTVSEKMNFDSIDESIYDCVKTVCTDNNKLLPELLREEEIFYISKIIDGFAKCEKSKTISLKTLIGIALKNSKEVDIENLKEDLLSNYGDIIIEDI